MEDEAPLEGGPRGVSVMREGLDRHVGPSEVVSWSLAGAGFWLKSESALVMIDTFLDELPEEAPVTRKPSFGYARLKEYSLRFKAEVAFVSTAENPPGLPWYMPLEHACEVAEMLSPRVFVPMHWNIFEETIVDSDRTLRAAEKAGIADRTRLLTMGESLTVRASGADPSSGRR
jgi:L-ascorbate metabolism protein UlaG (beta-lactamase superfamily)